MSISRDGESYLDIEFVGWGPQWSWMGWDGRVEESGNAARLVNRAKRPRDAEISLAATVRQTGSSATPSADRPEHDARHAADLHRGFAGLGRIPVRQEFRYMPNRRTEPNRIAHCLWTRAGLAIAVTRFSVSDR